MTRSDITELVISTIIVIVAIPNVLLCECRALANHQHRAGIYTNRSFGFQFALPDKLSCVSDPSPAPAHGCRIAIGLGVELSAWGIANALNETTEESERRVLHKLLPLATGITITRLHDENLDGLVARHIRVEYQEAGERNIVEISTAERKTATLGSVLYCIVLKAVASHVRGAQKIARGIIDSWQNIPIN